MATKVKSFRQTGKDPYESLSPETLKKIHRTMVLDRLLEERLIKMSKGGEGFFWIGGPGEEAFSVPLGFLVKKGQGLDHDYLHLHYRSSGIALAMGAQVIDSIRQMRTVMTDPYSRGRNFVNHYAIPEWNIMPVSPTIETQYSTCIGSAIAQKRHGGDGISIVNGGDAGSAEGDFHSCLVWSNRPANPLPILIIVVNNRFGISTPFEQQHGEGDISNWAKAFEGMPGKTINGNDPVESYLAIEEAMRYIRKERKPYLLEARCSRLHGHSSSSGANRVDEPDCISLFEDNLFQRKMMTPEEAKKIWTECREICDTAYSQVKTEPYPDPEDIWNGVFTEGIDDDYPKKGGS
ncbi:MAG: 3-methyl-2-oxobutanoate dehydrogenase [Deltaproteobacteria bacterium CG11_big_fil_rev_8_21_14_0_20_45_16]|nr:MAG: 3-methyl-2-oxobutanoate dehydrogenase [Deltaproteobacteria bacterium CG11_big_fil_rev_8_21_14_0_20_45_16]